VKKIRNIEYHTTRAIRKGTGDWNNGIGKKCPGCDIPIERDDLMVVEKKYAGKRKQREIDYLNRGMTRDASDEDDIGEYGSSRTKRKYPAKDAVYEDVYKWYYWHRKCWYEAKGKNDWYYPGVLAIDEEDYEVRNPETALSTDVQVIRSNKENGMDIAAVALVAGILLLGAGGYFIFIRHKYNVGDILQNLTEVAITHQVTEIKTQGLNRVYVLMSSQFVIQEIPVRTLDSDPNWIKK